MAVGHRRDAPSEAMSSIHHNFGPSAAGRTPPSTSVFTESSASDKARTEDSLQQPHFGPPSGPPAAATSTGPYPVGVGKGHRVASPSPYIGASGSNNYLPPSAPAATDYSNSNSNASHDQNAPGITSDSNVLPRIDLTHALEPESSCSSPYESPRLPPRARQGGIGSMGDITLPPLSSAVPMRRGAVSGESSGPSLPFPPMRLPYNDDDIPSRGPSPTLGRRPSFTLGHSRHVPPGPEVQLPTPALAGALERRQGMPIPAQANGSLAPDAPRNGISRPDEGAGYYYGNQQQNASIPRSTYRPDMHADEGGMTSVHPSYQQSGVPPHYNRAAEDTYYGHAVHAPVASYGAAPNAGGQPRFPQMYSRYTYGGDGSAGPQMGTMLLGHPHDDHVMAMNGKRPRSAPRVLSSQPRIFACTQCPARFARNHDLKRHQRGHLSVRPYPCTWCGKSFSRKDALKRHVLVKGCGKERKGGGGGGGSDDSSKKRSRSGDDRTERSRSELDGDDDEEDDEPYMKQDVSDEEDRLDAAHAQQRKHEGHHHQHQQQQQHQPQQQREETYGALTSSSSFMSNSGSSDMYGRRLSRLDPLSSEMSISRWPGNAPNPFSSIFTGPSAPPGGRLSISGLTSSFGNTANSGHVSSSLAPPAFRGSGADSLLSDMSFASSRRPSAVAGGA